MSMIKAFYFQHDYNASSDSKILFLRQQLGMEGYGIYWFVLEQLAQSGGYLPLKIIPVLAMQSQTQETKMRAVIELYELFQITEDQFFSIRMLDHLNIRKSLSESGKRGAEVRWENGGANRVAIAPPNGDPNAKERKERKEIKERNKERKVFTPPTKDEVGLFVEQEYNWDEISASGFGTKFTSYYQSTGWKRGKTSMKDWKATVRNWMIKEPQPAPVKKTLPNNQW